MITEIMTEGSWQSIETAPRDGTKIMLRGKYAQTENRLVVTVGHYLPDANCWVTTGGVMHCAAHWMPLPTPKRQTAKDVAPLKKISRMAGVERLRSKSGSKTRRQGRRSHA
jgi:hypothetical protein